VLHRPAVATVPEFAVRMAFGEMADETILSGQRVLPRALLARGFHFEWPTLEQALRHEMP
jgi:NAD dependent epimerase/dehydratase family enzyme